MLASLRRVFLEPPGGKNPEDGFNLRRWFALYCLWMAVLTGVVLWGEGTAHTADQLRYKAALLCLYVFYLTLCCTFCPLPTSWIVMLLASNAVDLIHAPALRLIVVSAVGAFGTCMANLNEYHIFTFILRYGKIARVRETRFYHFAAKWFAVSPFAVMALVSFIPIPVDVFRWLAITCRYSRLRFFAAYFVGRFCRYALWAATTIWFNLDIWHIMLIQIVLVLLAAVRILSTCYRRRKGGNNSRATADIVEATA